MIDYDDIYSSYWDNKCNLNNEQPSPISNESTPIADLVISDMQTRKEIGYSRYNKYLQANNGRDGLRDLYEELLDACMYIRQVMEENK
jgi:hypothetical protein